MGYDIIGDIHGHADALVELLRQMGYGYTGGAWRHPGRTAVFVGDFIDRGPAQVETVMIARAMIDCGAARAVMGNHEFNAIAWYLADPINDGQHLRRHTDKNRKQHQRFLDEVDGQQVHGELIDWFLSLPLWLELDGIRVVHACWHQGYIDYMRNRIGPVACLNEGLLVEASRWTDEAAAKRGTRMEMFDAVETLLKGVEVSLPEGVQFADKDGHVRKQVRTRWWDASAITYRTGAIIDPSVAVSAGFDAKLPEHALFWKDDGAPTFVGHYWLTGAPEIQNSRIAVIDYSIANGGRLAAYRWDGESHLRNDRLVSVGVS
jgi:hypothetical protein